MPDAQACGPHDSSSTATGASRNRAAESPMERTPFETLASSAMERTPFETPASSAKEATESRRCPKCGSPCITITCRNGGKNHGRDLYKCPERCEGWIGWVEDGDLRPEAAQRAQSTAAPAQGRGRGRGRGGNIGVAGRSFAEVKAQEKAASALEDANARKRNEGGATGAFVTFDKRKNICALRAGRSSTTASIQAGDLRQLTAECKRGRDEAFPATPSSASKSIRSSVGGHCGGQATTSSEQMRLARLRRFDG
eukprot:gnl/TRDRNA2_/TRDRNA2_80997_c0_seq2.p1 gnl/TRDRNA2_/TRDRNA2_80997_c0~~gnl/TRDRNA2_/TRDRNA2_80997_c0_seq2.p1  ORF type:complete len:293 (+),score=43.35 gnl/TRDRNA2_/TRDRNA2_80997_c0_seq2:120-881(+)